MKRRVLNFVTAWLAAAACCLSVSAVAQADATFACGTHTYNVTSGSTVTIGNSGDGVCSMSGSIPASASVTLNSVGVTVASGSSNAGTLAFTGLNSSFATSAGGAFTNSGTIVDNATGYRQELYAGTFTNTGTIHSAGGGDTLAFDCTCGGHSPGVLNNAGSLHVDAGADLQIEGPGSLKLDPGSSASIDPSGPLKVLGTTLDVAGGTVTGAISFFGSGVTFESTAASSSGAIDGQSNNSLTGTVPARWTITESGGALTAASGAANSGKIVLVSGNPALSATGAFVNKGTILDQFTGGTATVTASSLTNNGAITVSTGATLAFSGQLSNYSGSTATLTGGTYNLLGTFIDSDPALTTHGIMNDASKIALSGGSFTDSNHNNVLRNLTSIASRSLLALSGGTGLSTSSSLTNDGALSLGALSTINVAGSYTQASTATWGERITGGTTPHCGAIHATGTSSLAGTLAISAPASFKAPTGSTLTPLVASSNTGSFSSVTGTGPYASGESLTIGYTPTGYTLTVK